MGQVNVDTPPPRPPRPPNWPLYAFIAILIVVVVAALAITAARRGLFGVAQPTATPSAGPTATSASGAAPTATPSPGGAPTATPAASSATPPAAQPPTNPTALHVTSGSCSVHQIVWTWSGAQRATSYDVVIYDPRTGATVRSTRTHGTSYTLPAGPGATVALKVRSRNAAGTAPNFYTPGSVGRVPPATPNPRSMTSSTTGNKITWSWTAVPHATAYDVVLYHYSAGAAKSDITARTTLAHWSTGVTPGITYYLKVRTVGPCAPTGYFVSPKPVTAGATPTPHA